MLFEYIFMLNYILVFLTMGLLLFFLSFFFVYQKPYNEKMSSYECGFNPFEDASNKFEISFYLMAMLFMMFDLELLFLFPWVMSFEYINFEGHFSMLFFLFLLTLGFMYEWNEGALDWS